MKHVALLRGINVGGHRKLPMAELRDLAESNGLTDVETYIQSGNLIYSAPEALDVPVLLSEAIDRQHGYDVSVMVRSRNDLVAVVAASPFASRASQDSHLHIGFLSGAPTAEAIGGLARESEPPEEFQIIGAELHLHLGLGMGKSKLMRYNFAKALRADMTVRNWRTVNKLIEMMA